jgi:Holliday junction resolvase RusA-like endonuclease
MTPLRFTILGECASKSNSRELAVIGPKDNRSTILRKSQKAIDYVKDAVRQIPPACRVRLQGPVALRLVMYYASMRPDMDEQLLLDALQDQWTRSKPLNPVVPSQRVLLQPGVYCNDRQIVERHVYRRQDPKQPRTEVEVWSAAPVADMFAAEQFEPPPEELPF